MNELALNMNILLYGSFFIRDKRLMLGYKRNLYRHSRLTWDIHNPTNLCQSYEQIHHDDCNPLNDEISNLKKMTIKEHRDFHKGLKEYETKQETEEYKLFIDGQAAAIKNYIQLQATDKKNMKNNLVLKEHNLIPKFLQTAYTQYIALTLNGNHNYSETVNQDILTQLITTYSQYETQINELFSKDNYINLIWKNDDKIYG